MRTEYFLFVHHTTSILAKLSTWCFEHSGDISSSLLVNPSHTDEPWEGRTTCLWIHNIYIYISLYLSIYICIYIYLSIYLSLQREKEREREREKERESIQQEQQEINFICKSFQQCLYQLHIYNKILLQLSNLQIVFFTNFDFLLFRNVNINIKN